MPGSALMGFRQAVMAPKAILLLGFWINVIDGSATTNATLFPNLRRISALNTVLRMNNVDVIDNFDGPSLCHIPDLFFHSRIQDDTESGGSRKRIAVNGIPQQAAAAIALAIEHLNAGDGTVVSDLDGLDQRCDVRFSTEFLDTALSPVQAVDQVIDAIYIRKERKPCAFLGAGLSASSMASATVTGLKKYPQLSWISISSKLSDKEQFKLFARLPPPTKARSLAYLGTLYDTLGARRVALIYSDDPAILETMNSVQEVGRESYPDLILEPIPYSGKMSASTAKTVVNTLKRSKCTYVHAEVLAYELEPLMRESILQNVVGTGKHVWTFKDIHRETDGRIFQPEFSPKDPLFNALRGGLRWVPVVGMPGVGRYDAFVKAWQEIGKNENDIEYLRSMLPKYPEDPAYQPVFNSSTFDKAGPYFAAAYDATVLLGLAACGTPTKYFTGEQLYTSMFSTSFIGATGYVGLDPETRARSKYGGMWRLVNIQGNSLESGNVTLNEVDVGFFNGTEWLPKNDIIFNDGSTTPPAYLPPVNEELHFLSSKMRFFGFCLSGVVVASSIAMSLWAFTFEKRARVIQAAQPLFLHLICVGTALMGFAIVPVALDDGYVGEDKASAACMTYPWLLALGWCISFSALFSKTMRVNKLFHNPSFRRVKVTASDVMRPMAVLLTVNVLILFLWTILAPLKFERAPLDYDEFGRQTESVGFCGSDKFWWFFTPLASVNFLALVIVNQQAYVARKISTEFAESDYIGRAVGMIILVASLVVPVAVISGVNTGMHFFVSVSFISTVALSLLFYIFLPKMLYRPKSSMAGAVRASMALKRTSAVNGSDFAGEEILIHPKLVAADEDEKQTLREDNARLIAELSSLKASLAPRDDGAAGNSELGPLKGSVASPDDNADGGN